MSRLWQIKLKKWSCAKCGFSTGRKSTVKRHIANPNIHDGHADLVSFEEYVTGVRSNSYAPPTNAYRPLSYVTPYRKVLRHSKVTRSDIMIHIADLIRLDWRERFRTMFSNAISLDAKSGSINPALFRTKDGSIFYINYYSYVCPFCFSIGLTYDQKASTAINEGDHLCPQEVSGYSISTSGKGREDLRNDIGDLLFEATKIIAAGRKMLLVGHTDYQNLWNFYTHVEPTSFREFERGVIFGGAGRMRLSDLKLTEYF